MTDKLQSSPRKEKAEATRRKLIDSAKELFSENGYKGTSVRAINRKVGLADGLLYHYFPGGKKELFRVIVTESFQRIVSDTTELLIQYQSKALPIEELFEIGFLRFSEVVNSNLDIIRIIVREKEVREIFTENEILAFSENTDLCFTALLKNRMETGEIRCIDCKNAAFVIKSLMLNYLLIKAVDLGKPGADLPLQYARLIRGQAMMWKNHAP